MGTAIRKHIKDFAAILVLVAIAAGITLFILVNQKLSAPDWVPVLGKQTYTFKAEFTTAQAVTPGQGQSVNIAGVPVGQVMNATLENGRAIISMELEEKYKGRIYPNATMLLRPKTSLKDMVVTLDPGTPAGGAALAPGDVLPISRTAPDVNFEEFLSVLDADTRDYLVLLINGGGEGLARNGRTLAQVLRELDPFQRNVAKINQYLQKREKNIKRVTTSLSGLLNELGSRNTQLAAFVESSNGALKNFAAQKENIKQTIALLPGALTSTKSALNSIYKTSEISGPTLTNLLPAANGLADAQIAAQGLFNATENDPPHVISDQLTPFAKESVPALELLKSTTGNVVAAGPGLLKFGESLNYGSNSLEAAPPGEVRRRGGDASRHLAPRRRHVALGGEHAERVEPEADAGAGRIDPALAHQADDRLRGVAAPRPDLER
ncbi:MAG: MlaD family protein, partial [Actinomycetes bacterium]